MNEKLKVIIAYLLGWIGGLIILYGIKNNTRETKIHAAQSIVASAGMQIICIIGTITFIFVLLPFIPIGLYVLSVLVIIFGIIKACNDEPAELPIIGDWAKTIFKSKIEE